MKEQTAKFITISSHSSWTARPWRRRQHEAVRMSWKTPSNMVLHSRRIFRNTGVRNSYLFLVYCVWISLSLIFRDVSSHPVGTFLLLRTYDRFRDWTQHVVCYLPTVMAILTGVWLFAVILGRSHYLLFTLAAAMQPRMLVTFDEELNPLPVPVRVGLVSFTNCQGLVNFTNCQGLVSFTHCQGLVSFTNCQGLVSFTNCQGLVSFTNCQGLVCFTDCQGLVSFTNCQGLVSFTNCHLAWQISVNYSRIPLIRHSR